MFMVGVNWSSLAITGILIGVYLLGLGVFVLIKRHKIKKSFDKEVKKNEKEENK